VALEIVISNEPITADAILKTSQIPTQLKGLAIGNGWMDPLRQYPAYLEFAVKEKLIKEGTKVRRMSL
jgi:carboxypeptidase D